MNLEEQVVVHVHRSPVLLEPLFGLVCEILDIAAVVFLVNPVDNLRHRQAAPVDAYYLNPCVFHNPFPSVFIGALAPSQTVYSYD